MPKSDQELLNDLRNIDSGYCNPIKIKMAEEDEKDIRSELKDRGWNDRDIDDQLK